MDDLKAVVESLAAAAKQATEAAQSATAAALQATAAVERTEAKVDALSASQLESHEEGRRNHATLALAIQDQGRTMSALRRAVHGSDPPPPDAPELEGSAPLDELAAQADAKASRTALELAALEGRVIRGFADMQKLTKDQNTALGIGARGARYLFSPAGRRDVIKVLALAAALLGYDQARHTPPAPVYVVPPLHATAPPLPLPPLVP